MVVPSILVRFKSKGGSNLVHFFFLVMVVPSIWVRFKSKSDSNLVQFFYFFLKKEPDLLVLREEVERKLTSIYIYFG